MSILDMPNRLFKLLATLGVVLCLFWLFRIYEIWNTVTGNYVREISVEGEGNAFVVPDLAIVNLGVSTESELSDAAVDENTTKMNAVLAAVKALGIEDKDIQTTSYNLYPNYEWTEDGGEIQTGYTVEQYVEVRLTDFAKIGELIGAASTAGANYIGGVSFEVDDPDAAKAEAREEAIARAKEKAEQIAEASGLRLGDLVSYYEYSYDYDYGKDGGEFMSMESATAYAESPEINPGEQEVTLTVSLSYQIR